MTGEVVFTLSAQGPGGAGQPGPGWSPGHDQQVQSGLRSHSQLRGGRGQRRLGQGRGRHQVQLHHRAPGHGQEPLPPPALQDLGDCEGGLQGCEGHGSGAPQEEQIGDQGRPLTFIPQSNISPFIRTIFAMQCSPGTLYLLLTLHSVILDSLEK